MRYIHEAHDTPVLDDVDVLVCGGGMTGFPAAVAAARNGAKTMLVDSEGSLGGTATAGAMNGYPPVFNDGQGNQVVGGIVYELTERLRDGGALPADSFTPTEGLCKLQFDPEILKREAMSMVSEAGSEVLLRCHMISPLLDGKSTIGASFVSRKGRFAVIAKAVVDATGDGSLAAWAGVPFEEATSNTSTLMFRICNIDLDRAAEAMASRMEHTKAETFRKWYRRHGTLSIVIQSDFPDIYREAVDNGEFPRDPRTKEGGFDMQGIHGLLGRGFAYVFGPIVRGSCLDPVETSRSEIAAAQRVWDQMRLVRKVPGLEEARVVQVASALGVRGSRHLRCEYEMTPDDVSQGARFEDSIGQGCRFVSWMKARERFRGRAYQIPFRALLPLGVEGLLTGGRSISRGTIRGMVNCAVVGEACGAAAALSSQAGVSPRALSVPLLQQRLRQQGALVGPTGPGKT